MIRILLIILILFLLAGCSTIEKITDPKPTIITDNMGTPENKDDDRVITVNMKSDATVKYTKTETGYTIEIDNRGSKSFARAMAEKLVENATVVLAPGVDSVGSEK